MLTKYELSLIMHALLAHRERILQHAEPGFTEFNALLDQEAHQYLLLYEKLTEMHKNAGETIGQIADNL
jgi:hypothetical protein